MSRPPVHACRTPPLGQDLAGQVSLTLAQTLAPRPHLRLGQDLEHLVVGQEEEAREEEALLLQVRRQALLHLLQQAARLLERLQALWVLRAEQQEQGKEFKGGSSLACSASWRLASCQQSSGDRRLVS